MAARIGGAVDRPYSLTLHDIESLPARTERVTMECAGNGRARLNPRPISQPWLYEAIGTAEWTGTALWPLLERAGLTADAVEVVFTGADRGVQGDVEQDYARSLAIAELRRPEVMLVYAMNGRATGAAARLPTPPDRSRLVRNDERQMADLASTLCASRFRATSRLTPTFTRRMTRIPVRPWTGCECAP